MLNDEKTSDEPDKGFKIKKNSGSFEELWNIATASYDWTTLTGIDTGTSGDEIIIETQPARTFMVWGISFHKEQFELRNPNGLSLQMAYNYYKDVNTGAYGADDMRNPTNLEDGKHTFTINPSDLDDLGNYYFNDADGNPLVLTASTLYLNLESDILNFDLIGTDINYGGMATGKKSSGSNYLFHTETIDSFWVKGTSNINTIFCADGIKCLAQRVRSFQYFVLFSPKLKSFVDDGTEGSTISTWSESKARASCRNQCGASDVYHGIRKSSENQFTCRCFDRTFASLLGKVSI